MHAGNPMGPHGNMTMNGSPLRSMHQMNNAFGLNSHPMEGPPMHNNRGGMIPGGMMGAGGNQMPGMNNMNPMNNMASMGGMQHMNAMAGGMNSANPMNNMGNMNNNMPNMNNMGNMNNMNPMNSVNMNNMNPMNAMNNANSNNMSSMSPLGQLAQMQATPNSHMNINSPGNPRIGSSSPSLAGVHSPLGPNGNRVPGSASPHPGAYKILFLLYELYFIAD